jgi:hypothetical protein
MQSFSIDKIEQTINEALISCINKKNANDLLILKYQMIEILNNQPTNELKYWLAYNCENIAIFHGLFNEKEKEEREIKEGIKLLEEIQNKTSEHFALLSMMDGYAVKFTSPLRIAKHIEKCKVYAKQALELHPKNPRAYLSLGIFDYYTHETYGASNAEENLKKTIEFKDEIEENNSLSPKWGINIGYEFLIKFYLKTKNKELINKYMTEALLIFPEDKNLNELKKINKL